MSRSIKIAIAMFAGVLISALCFLWLSQPKELTLADFQSQPTQPDPFWQGLHDSGLDPDDWVRLMAATDDCQLGITAREISLAMGVIDTMIENSSGPEGAYRILLIGLGRDYSPPHNAARLLDLHRQSQDWAIVWNSSSKTLREYECGKLMDQVRQVRG